LTATKTVFIIIYVCLILRRLTAPIVAALLLGSCSGRAGSSSAGGSGPIQVVAAENFYGDIASQLGGKHVEVTSILSDPNADPHLFEPGTANAAAVGGADLVIVNGLGYDAFMNRLLRAAPNGDRRVVTVARALHMAGSELNPHIWYDVASLHEIAKAISHGLASVDPVDETYFDGALGDFDASLRPLTQGVARIRSRYGGEPVAYTEPVPGYLLRAAGLKVRTPEGFAVAIEEASEPTPQAVAAMHALLADERVRVLIYNAQATSPITDGLRRLARQHGIPVVPMTETLPSHTTFQQWQIDQVRSLERALAG
jgi:zinc/manganese transport system substrate-binding protein